MTMTSPMRTSSGGTIGLEQFSDLKEEHDEYGFRELRFCSRQEAYAQGTYSRYGHQEVLVEHVSVRDTLGRLFQCGGSDQQVGYQIDEKQLPCRQGAVLLYEYRSGQQDCAGGDKDDPPFHAPAFMSGLSGAMMPVIMMFVCHDSSILFLTQNYGGQDATRFHK